MNVSQMLKELQNKHKKKKKLQSSNRGRRMTIHKGYI